MAWVCKQIRTNGDQESTTFIWWENSFVIAENRSAWFCLVGVDEQAWRRSVLFGGCRWAGVEQVSLKCWLNGR